ncbi:hypothetical protein Pfo_021011 [Paulownia fortunei]|nr:hypothetical protein Pfo_021011 [Paulownia fortunei]
MAPAATRFQVLAILMCGMFLLGINLVSVSIEACPLICYDVVSMTCNGTTVNPTRCNCCGAPKGCTLHLANGASVYCD